MKLGYLAYRNMVSKPLNLLLSLLLLVLSVSLVSFVLQLSEQLKGQMQKNIAPFDMVVGAKGSPLQLVLSSVLHIDTPTGNIKLQEAQQIQKHPFVGSAIPVSYGDNYKGYRVLGTVPDYFKKYDARLATGQFFKSSFQVVAGSTVAKTLGLKIGDVFTSAHGLAAGAATHDAHPFTVVGLLEPTGTVLDQLLVCDLESIWAAHDHGATKEDHQKDQDHQKAVHEHATHDDHHHEDDHEHEQQEAAAHLHKPDLEITSLLVKFKSPLGLVQMPRFINQNTNMQAALPAFEVQRLMGLLGAGVQTINGIAIAILLVSGLSIFISLLKTIRERRHELALLRTYGLGTPKLLLLVLLEGLFLSTIGFWIGWALGRLALGISAFYMEATYGYALQIKPPNVTELLFFAATLVITMIAVFLASTSIFKLNISKTLINA